jgi:hypothetical protein
MAAGADETAPPERPREERYGVLRVDRRHKDDGRALTLYSHHEDVDEPGESTADAHDEDTYGAGGDAAVESGEDAEATSLEARDTSEQT